MLAILLYTPKKIPGNLFSSASFLIIYSKIKLKTFLRRLLSRRIFWKKIKYLMCLLSNYIPIEIQSF